MACLFNFVFSDLTKLVRLSLLKYFTSLPRKPLSLVYNQFLDINKTTYCSTEE